MHALTGLQAETFVSGGKPAGLVVRLHAPERRNALSMEMVDSLHELLQRHPDHPLLIGSSAPGIFSAGADLGIDSQTRARLSDRLYACYELMLRRPGIIIAVVDGPAVGGGAQLTTAADLRIASPRASWRWVGPRHGLAVGAWILPELVGRSLALELTLTGRWLPAPEALTAGLVADLADDPWQAAFDTAASLRQADQAALARVKQVATRPELFERLTDERRRNHESWSGHAPSPRDAAAEARRSRLTDPDE